MPDTTPMRASVDRGDHELPRLALRPKDAAKALGIGQRLLWSLTNQGVIPHVKVGRATLYPVDLLRDWLVKQAAKVTHRDTRC